jgi:hypothetical protein
MTPDLGGGSGLVGTTASMPRQAVTDEPADREIDLGLAHQPSVMHDPEQKPGQHEPHCSLRVDAGAAVVGAVKVGHLGV